MNEASNRPWWLNLAASVRQLPTDLGGVVVAVLVVDALLLLHVVEGPPRFALALPVLVFLPGYVLVATLFPARHRAVGVAEEPLGRIDGVERAALSVATSLVVLMLYALLVDVTPLVFSQPAVLGGLTVFVVVGAFVGAIRRLELPSGERFRVPIGRWYGEVGGALLHPGSRVDGVLNLLVLVSVLAAVGAFGYALAAPAPNAGYTEFQLLTEDDGGELVASGYPTSLTAGEEAPLVASVTNHEGGAQTYSVVVELQRVRSSDGSVTVLEETELQRTQSTVDAGETWNWRHALAPPSTMLGEDLRVQYTLYQGEAPADASAEDAYRRLHLWISVDDAS